MGLPSLVKTKLWRREKQNEKTGNKCLKPCFTLIALLTIELRKREVVGNHFIEFFFSLTIWEISKLMIANDSPQNRSLGITEHDIVPHTVSNAHNNG